MDENRHYIVLNGQQIARYGICYQLRDTTQCADSIQFTSKSSVLVKRFEQFNQQNNLVFVDMLFPNILADIALEVYFQNASTFANYLQLPRSFQIINQKQDARFLNERIRKFIEYILFSDIHENKKSSGTINNDVKYRYDYGNECLFFTSLNASELIELGYEKIILTVETPPQQIGNHDFILYLNVNW